MVIHYGWDLEVNLYWFIFYRELVYLQNLVSYRIVGSQCQSCVEYQSPARVVLSIRQDQVQGSVMTFLTNLCSITTKRQLLPLICCSSQAYFLHLLFSWTLNVPCATSDMLFKLGIFLPSVAFLNPKCALWDCPRPAQGSNEGLVYCNNFHEELALSEGTPGMCLVLRPGRIDLKDGPLFAALTARVNGRTIGIPELHGAATSKTP
jgi:hypothetical protein